MVFGRVLRSLEGGSPHGEAPTLWVLGDGRFSIDAVGESNYQRALELAAGGRRSRGVNKTVTAELRLEDDNAYDSLAVAVFVEGERVGYLSRSNARLFREEVGEELRSAGRVLCKGRIRGGWSRGPKDRGYFGIALDIGAVGGAGAAEVASD